MCPGILILKQSKNYQTTICRPYTTKGNKNDQQGMSFLHINWTWGGKKIPGINLASSSQRSMSVLLPPPAGKQIMKLVEFTG